MSRTDELIAGRFRVIRQVGQGGGGCVYEATDAISGAHVALKIIDLEELKTPGRFAREAQVLAALDHPGISRYVAHGERGGEGWLALEWAEGQPLDARLRLGRLDIAEAVQVGVGVADALGAAHAAGVVHRDIKPANLLLVDGQVDNVRLLDFGVAHSAASAVRLTRTGTLVGTPAYMAPEQVRGGSGIDSRADIFALGCVLYETLAGRPPFIGHDVVAIVAKIVLEDVPPLRRVRPEVPEALEELLGQMLAKDPAERPTAAAVKATLEAVDGTSPPRLALPAQRGARYITDAEQRVVSIVLIGAPVDAADEDANDTVEDDELPDRVDDVRFIVSEFGARVVDLGDGMLIVLLVGDRLPTEQARRAARCGLALRDVLPGVPLVLATGRGVVTASGAPGEVIERAVATARKTAAGELRTDPPTLGLLGEGFDVASEDGVVRVLGEAEALEAGDAAFVGREAELVQLDLVWGGVGAPNGAAIVSIAGPAGIGKTALLDAFIARARETAPRLAVLSGAGDAARTRRPFGVAARMLQAAAGIRRGDGLLDRQERLRVRFGTYLDEDATPAVVPFLGELAGVPFADSVGVGLDAARRDPAQMTREIGRALASWLTAECAARRVMLVVDDAHWCDAETLQLFAELLSHHRDLSLVVILAGRFDDLPSALWGTPLTPLELEPLGPAASAELVRKHLGPGADDSVVQSLVEPAAGNPFHLLESVRAAARGQRGGALPASVIGMVQSRLAELSPEARRAVRAASIYMADFGPSAIGAMMEGDVGDEVWGWLGELVHHKLIALACEPASGAEPTYRFASRLIRDAAYGMLTAEDRTNGHAVAAEWLDGREGVDKALIARHFQAAGDTPRAAMLVIAAAEQALAEGNPRRATLLAGRAESIGASGALLGRTRLVQARAAAWAGDDEDAAKLGLEAAVAFSEGSSWWLRAVAILLTAYASLRKDAPLVEWARRIEKVDPTDDVVVPDLVAALCAAARPLLRMGRAGLADTLVKRAEALAGWLDEPLPRLVGAIAHVQGNAHALSGEFGTALRPLGLAVAAFERDSDTRATSEAKIDLGSVVTEAGAYPEAEHVLRAALNAAQEAGLAATVARARVALTVALARSGRLEEAVQVGEAAREWYALSDDARMVGIASLNLAEAYALAKDKTRAVECADKAINELITVPVLQPWAYATLAYVYMLVDDEQAMVEPARKAMAVLERRGTLEAGELVTRLVFAEASWCQSLQKTARGAIAAMLERIDALAATVEDEALRKRFLEDGVFSRRAREMADGWGLDA